MKTSFTLMALCLTMMVNAQWLQNTSCDKNAALITNQAIEYAMNLEYMAAFGAANSALLLDEDCGCAKLTLAYISSSNPKWGSRAKKLDAINKASLTPEEKGWYDTMRATDEQKVSLETTLVSQFPESPLINFFSTSAQDFNTFNIFADKFPDNAASAYNMMSYGYANGAYGEKDTTNAMKYVGMSQKMHDGPNSYDSMAEHYASIGDYENALKNQLKAIDFATFSSPYRKFAQLYYAKTVASETSKEIQQMQKDMQKAILDGDYQAYKVFEHPEIKVSTGDSNLDPFYVYTEKDVTKNSAITWAFFTLSDMQTYFSPDMKTAVITFVADGEYTITKTNKTIEYATRASSTWTNTEDGWKILHTSFAPRKGKIGIPERG
jgi:tetratricopeptide (TPR) repeat protein